MSGDKPDVLGALQERIGYHFSRGELLEQAMTHSSRARKHNERLEFLGDRVLGLVVVEQLIERFPDEREGELARRFNNLVKRETCTRMAREFELDKVIGQRLHRRVRDVTSSDNVLGDATEALVGAIYLDGGLEAARDFIVRHWGPMFDASDARVRDAKTRLQEWALGKGMAMPSYTEVSREGPDHALHFVMSVHVGDYPPVTGEGSTKRAAEQVAAEAFIKANRIRKQ